MLTYSPFKQRSFASTHQYPWLLMLLVFAWLWAGVFSHDLWNPAEPQIYTAISESHSAWLPTVLGEPYFQLSPVYLCVASSLKMWFSPWLMDSYSASRLVSVLFTIVGLTAIGVTAHKLLNQHNGRSAVLILIGSAGLLPMTHFLSDMSVAFAGVSLCLWAITISNRQVVFASLLLGVGCVFLGQSLGWLTVVIVWLVAVGLLFHSAWYKHRLLTVLVVAILLILPIFAMQLMMLAKLDSQAFHLYVSHNLFGAFGGLGGINLHFNLWYYLKHLLWFAFPAYPLMAWTLIRAKNLLATKLGGLSMAWLLFFGIWLAVNPQTFQDNLIVVLPILAILGAAKLDDLRRGVAAFLNWFGIMTFGATAVFLWLGFFAMNYGFPAKLAQRAMYFSPYYVPDIDPMPMIVAILFTPAWIFAITRKRIRGRQAVSNWASGMTLAWSLGLTLFLPWLDAAKSYRPVIKQMQAALDSQYSGCLNIATNHQAAYIAWQQYGHLPIAKNKQLCDYTLIQVHPKADLSAWQSRIIWQGKRPRNKHEAFVLLKN